MGVERGKFLRVRRIFDRISPNRPERFAYKFSPPKILKIFFRCGLQKRSSCVFLQTLGAIFAQILKDFAQIFRDFGRIFYQSKLLECSCTPASYTALGQQCPTEIAS